MVLRGVYCGDVGTKVIMITLVDTNPFYLVVLQKDHVFFLFKFKDSLIIIIINVALTFVPILFAHYLSE